jgi:hypothetical protein
MRFNLKSIGAIVNINFRQTTWIAYLVAFLVFASTSIQTIVYYLLNIVDGAQVSSGNELIVGLIIVAVLIPAVNFKKIMHINGKKVDFFWASIVNYISFSAVLSILNLILYYTFETAMGSVVTILNVINIFGWIGNGVIAAFFMQFAFYLLLGVTLHTLTLMQTFWLGWVLDLVIAAIVSVFIPIAPLRALLVDFFNLIIFNPNPISHIVICLVLAAAIYALNIPILSRKKI